MTIRIAIFSFIGKGASEIWRIEGPKNREYIGYLICMCQVEYSPFDKFFSLEES